MLSYLATGRANEPFLMKRNFFLFVASILLSLAAGEVLLRVSTDYPIRDSDWPYHPALSYMMPTKMKDIDEFGFRNPSGLGNVDFVAIGDSHTFGYNVESDDTWPAILAEERHQSVYNYGVPGYGILQYRWLFEEALSKNPKSIIVGFYVGNDLNDYCRQARKQYWRDQLKERGIEESACAERKRNKEEQDSLADRINSLWLSTAIGDVIDKRIREPLDEYLYERGKGLIVVEYGSHETMLPLRKFLRHNKSIDLDRKPTAEAYRVFKQLLEEMAEIAQTHGVHFGVLLIPTKESTFFEKVDESDAHYNALKDVVLEERAFIGNLAELLHQLNIPTASPLPCLQSTSHGPLYPEGIDGHPLRPGYECYAEAAGALLTPATDSSQQQP